MINDDLKARIKDLPCSQVIGLYLPIVQKGRNMACRCPFHDDNDPSLMINDDKGMWRCWVDDIGGDAISFVQRYLKNASFPEALEDICRRLGWNFDDFVTKEVKVDPKVEMARKLLSKTSQLYRKIATETNCTPYQDFLKKRGISEEHAATYQLGFAPQGNVLLSYFESIPSESERDFALKIALDIGLLKKSENLYDTFRGRIVFPIWDQFGHVIGFTARTIDDNKGPKYLNSSGSFIFNKKELLYGFHLAKNTMRERGALIVEGNMDQLSLFTKGFENSVAVMGVALGDQSLKRLTTLTKNIYLGLDNDSAGKAAEKRMMEQFLREGILTRSVSYAPHKDGDDFLVSEGTLALQKVIDEAPTTLDNLLSEIIPSPIPSLTDRKIEILQKGFALVAPLKVTLQATERLVELAKRLGLGVDAAQITKSYEEFLKGMPTARAPVPSREVAPVKESKLEEAHQVPLPTPSMPKVERFLLQEIVQHPELLTYEKTLELLDFCESDGVKLYISRLRDEFYEISDSGYEALIRDVLNSEEFALEIREAAIAGLFKYRPTELDKKTATRMLFDLKKRLQLEKLQAKRSEILKEHESAISEEQSHQLMARLMEIDKELNQVKRLKPNSRET